MTRSLPHILRYLFKLLRGHRLQVTLNILAGVVLVGLDLAFVWATKLAIDIATEHSCALPLRFAFGLIAAIMLSRITSGIAVGESRLGGAGAKLDAPSCLCSFATEPVGSTSLLPYR